MRSSPILAGRIAVRPEWRLPERGLLPLRERDEPDDDRASVREGSV